MKYLKIVFFILLIGSTGSISSTVFAEPQITATIEKPTYTYCERLSYTIEVSEITGEFAVIHIRDETGKKSSAIPIPIEKASNPIPSAYPFQKDIFPAGKYFIDIEYSGATTTLEFDLIDSDNLHKLSKNIQDELDIAKEDIFFISAATGEGTQALLNALEEVISKNNIDLA